MLSLHDPQEVIEVLGDQKIMVVDERVRSPFDFGEVNEKLHLAPLQEKVWPELQPVAHLGEVAR